MGKAKYFFVLSGILLLAGWTSIFFKGGLRYGIDFKGGTNVDVRFAQAPDIDRLRSGLAAQGLGNTEIQSARDIANPNSNEVLIFVEGRGQDEQTLQASREKVLSALNATYGLSGSNKADFNSATLSSLAAVLTEKDPLVLSVNAADRYQQLSRKLLDYRDKNANGVLTNFDDLAKGDGVTPAVLAAVKNSYALGPFAIRNVEVVGPKVGAELRRQAIFVTLYALGGMLVYIAFRFEWVYGAAAVLAVFHDVLITLGFFSLLHFEISLTVIAALLTLVGYSMNDTIVIFDRIRENNRLLRKESFADVVNKSINQTLSRTILTSGLTFLTVLVLFLMGGQVLRAFSFALVVGIVVGTYSSFGIAAPLVVAWNRWRGQGAAAGPGPAAGNKARGSENVAGRLAPAGRR
ncbi:MAG: protein translocase subunit SecF [Acidobacteria bacterium]|nr:MAG: protein translocase subunit SecF [Acidobacteriota bacterium]PYU42372.1 MAG: protein translocase subunit SecF [Acidobacteriota bacterium]PYU60376.1 MAG: protein translocase subunit SecF [Acidobacteriota bacterium]PYU75097.1 MAG: protein translocase subunit SecF [Acidobacteriota bacterium]